MKHPNIAIVYDWIDKWGGIERVLLELHSLFPEATFYTSYYNPSTAPWAKKLNIHTSFLQAFPSFIKQSRILSAPLYPYAFESFDFSSYDIVISVSSSYAKGIITRPATKHICYLLTPTRYLWAYPEEYQGKGFKGMVKSIFLSHARKWDYIASQRPDQLISISHLIAQRTSKYYHRASSVIYPPFDADYWVNLSANMFDLPPHIENNNYYLVVSRLEPYKKIDISIEAFSHLPSEQLVIVGDGSLRSQFAAVAGKNVRFLTNVSDDMLAALYKHAKGLIMMQEEDFGLVSLEAQSCGCPIITYSRSGAVETIIEGKTGILVKEQSVTGLLNALALIHTVSYNKVKIQKDFIKNNLIVFSKKAFKEQFLKLIYL